jgi:NTF2 fold immunity protein
MYHVSILKILFGMTVCIITRYLIPNDMPYRKDIVPNEVVASKVAETLLTERYGNDIKEQIPFKILLTKDNVWIVRGTRKKPQPGGVAEIHIRKKDCTVVKMGHGK